MPYTLSHPGFILPFKKWQPQWFSATGFVFGSIAPDFDILLRLSNARFHLFDYSGYEILFLILPLAMLSGTYYHLVIRGVLLRQLPAVVRSRFNRGQHPTFKTRPALRGIRLAYSALAAILLHIFLDNISHWDAYPFKIYGWIYYNNFWAGIIYYYIALYAPVLLFSLGGILLILYYINPKNLPAQFVYAALKHPPLQRFTLVFGILTLLVAVLKITISGIEAGFYIDHIVISLTNGMLVSFFLTPTLYALRRRYDRGKPAPPDSGDGF